MVPVGIQWQTGIVIEIVAAGEKLQEIVLETADGDRCRAYHDLTAFAPLRPGDEVLANTTAVALGLGTGGAHFVLAPLAQVHSGGGPLPPGHIMKLRYTALQRAVLAVEEADSGMQEKLAGRSTLERMPVLIGELHSMLPAAVAWLRCRNDGKQPVRIAYIMTDGAALPIALSRHVDRLNALGWLAGTITYGHAYGGDLEAVNKYTALLAAKHVLEADIAIVTMGPGIVGTGTPYGYTGIETGELVNAVSALGGIPVFMPRVSFGDARERHRGLSHHSITALKTAALASAAVPLPLLSSPEQADILRDQAASSRIADKHRIVWREAPSPDRMEAALCAYGAAITSMGRGWRDDPPFFAAVCTAADEALAGLAATRPAHGAEG
ncbi:hypothetical protein PAESOLCIP111_01499 [Paenibacillus solanacearum]|uniref:DUF3866 family protein n=1 Tax=Paenibacillus solanacearum TaxID=2048548 RepID=A0A916NVY0_9BACL|nr:DUF3866 family protein [Paenibacillus solanacearum]CAG7612220.1 hypothetical protein PAESOLCIP111_01499 [Paenibacillus solanacearum]